MRPLNEVNDPSKLLEFAKSKRLLQFSSHESLGEVTSLLYGIVLLADKNMPIKAYLDVVRQMQTGSRQDQIVQGLAQVEQKAQSNKDAAAKERALIAVAKARTVMNDVHKSLQEKINEMQWPELGQMLSSLRPLAFEDEFVMTVAFLDLEVSKLGAITYLKGESPDYKETKRRRSILDTHDESVLKNLSASLTRPNDERGSVEVGMILSSIKRFGHLISLRTAMEDVVRRINRGETKHDILQEVKTGVFKEKLTLTDYDVIVRMARREKKITTRVRQKDAANKYELQIENHHRVKEVATRLGVTPRRALNKIVDDFFALTNKQEEFGSKRNRKE